MEMNEFDTIFRKSFGDLSPDEKTQISEFVQSEEEFEGMKIFLLQLEQHAGTNKGIVPNDAIKSKLDDVFNEVHPKDKGVGLWAVLPAVFPADKRIWQQPIVRIAAVLIIALMAVPFFRSINEDKVQLADIEKNELKSEENKGYEDQSNAVNTEEVLNETQTRSVFPNLSNEDREGTSSRVLLSENHVTPLVADIAASSPGSMSTGSSSHPDGIFKGDQFDDATVTSSAAVPVSRNLAVLDLLTATF